MFVDNVEITVKAGSGGDGLLHFHREKFVAQGGPDGGDGGRGGNVFFVAKSNQHTLYNFRYQKDIKAEDGHPGGVNNRHGKDAPDILLAVPIGTVVTDFDGVELADLSTENDVFLVCRGGAGGLGNQHFATSTHRTPRISELGDRGEFKKLRLELKTIADVGIIGLPNAGKSSFLSSVSNAKPKIANYRFTTLSPELGVAQFDEKQLILADIPGLIEDASEGKGLGHQFLRHIERTNALLHVIDAYSDDIARDYQIIRKELKKFSKVLADKKEIVAINKVEGLDDEIKADIEKQLKKVTKNKIFFMSTAAHQNTKEVLRELAKNIEKRESIKSETIIDLEYLTRNFKFKEASSFKVEKLSEKRYKVTGERIERLYRQSNFALNEATDRLRRVMNKMGVEKELTKLGLKYDDEIQFGNEENIFKYN